MDETLAFQNLGLQSPKAALADAVLQGLRAYPKHLPSRLFYDARGSELFEQITALPGYYPTRTERSLLEIHVDEMVHTAGKDLTLVEFGSGSSIKTRLIIEAMLRQSRRLTYAPIDISADFLQASAASLQADYPELTITAFAAEYFEALDNLYLTPGPRLFLFLGSNIGNFDQSEAIRFLKGLRRAMNPGDRLLLGIDLVKDLDILEAAYNDSSGVTEAFNKNLLTRLNAELGANFDLDAFSHIAKWVPEFNRIEMHLESRWSQTVTFSELDKTYHFASGETIHTENSHKYTLRSLQTLADHACLELQTHWSDPKSWFALTLLAPI
jgi:dimethylhistidine N-methyltransferase